MTPTVGRAFSTMLAGLTQAFGVTRPVDVASARPTSTPVSHRHDVLDGVLSLIFVGLALAGAVFLGFLLTSLSRLLQATPVESIQDWLRLVAHCLLSAYYVWVMRFSLEVSRDCKRVTPRWI